MLPAVCDTSTVSENVFIHNNNKLLHSQKSKLKKKHIGFEMLLTNAKSKTTFRWFIVFGELNKKVEMHKAKECNIEVNELSRSIWCILFKLMYRKGMNMWRKKIEMFFEINRELNHLQNTIISIQQSNEKMERINEMLNTK